MLSSHNQQRGHAEVQTKELSALEANHPPEEFLGIVCHELKTPLTILKGNIQLAEQKVQRFILTFQGEVPEIEVTKHFAANHEHIDQAKRQIHIQNRLVNDLLDVSHIQANTLSLLKKPCNLISIVRAAVEDQRQIAFSRTISLKIIADRKVPMFADIDRIGQVVMNYLNNAIKYSPADRPVEVCLSVERQMACVSVHDEGPGIPLEEQERIWERFYRVPSTQVPGGSSSGLGIGLYICRSIIERHHGQFGVESMPGKGSTFWFMLPLATED